MRDLAEATLDVCLREAGQEPLPGYRLVEPLGRGGFGEVWKCIAPGGPVKALKFVGAGHEGDPTQAARVEQEREGLQHVNAIRHPFLLSTERIEQVGDLLIVVMELADQNLLDLCRQLQSAGKPGIPRDPLLNLLVEAAEALDFLQRRHQLQHLDVKPGNLFLISGHLKVGDFGLVSPLDQAPSEDTGRRQADLTPLYVAPERLQGSISPHSDQYSLAVVYQELLTGVPPFQGQSAMQVTLQHLKGQPNLDPLPAHDRPVVARALARNPDDRFPSCLDFVYALCDAEPNSPRAEPKNSSNKDTKHLSLTPVDTRQRGRFRRTGVGPTTRHADRASARRNRVVEAPTLVGGFIPGHEIVTLRGRGALGEVYQVRSEDGRHRLARFLPLLSASAEAIERDLVERLADLDHPVLPPMEIYWSHEGRVIVVSDGGNETLLDRFRECVTQKMVGVPRPELMKTLWGAAEGLDALARRSGLHHLRLQPSRIQLLDEGIWLADFGLAELIEKVGGYTLEPVNRHTSSEILEAGCRATADTVQLALIYAELLTGVPPMSRRAARPAGQPRKTKINLEMLSHADRDVVTRALDADPKKRFQTCAALMESLEAAGAKPRQTPTAAVKLPPVIFAELGVAESAEAAHVLPPAARIVRDVLAVENGQICLHNGFPYLNRAGQFLESRCPVKPVQGMLQLKLKMFAEQSGAKLVSQQDGVFLFKAPTPTGVWRQMLGREAGLEIHLELPSAAAGGDAVLQVRTYGQENEETRRRLTEAGPELLKTLAGCLPVITDRRREPRWPCYQPVRVYALDGKGQLGPALDGEGHDLSLTGIRFFLPQRLTSGQVYLGWPTLAEHAELAILGQVVREMPLDGGRVEVAVAWKIEPDPDFTP